MQIFLFLSIKTVRLRIIKRPHLLVEKLRPSYEPLARVLILSTLTTLFQTVIYDVRGIPFLPFPGSGAAVFVSIHRSLPFPSIRDSTSAGVDRASCVCICPVAKRFIKLTRASVYRAHTARQCLLIRHAPVISNFSGLH